MAKFLKPIWPRRKPKFWGGGGTFTGFASYKTGGYVWFYVLFQNRVNTFGV